MATRTLDVGSFAALQTYRASHVNALPGGWLGYATTATNQGSISTTAVDLTDLAVTVTSLADRILRLSAWVPMRSTVANDRLVVRILEGSTILSDDQTTATQASLAYVLKPTALMVAPSAGLHTYKVAALLGGGATGTGSTFHETVRISFLLVEDIGPSS